MRIAITGATGNVGTSVLAALAGDMEIRDIVAIARRPALVADERVRFHPADISRDDLTATLRGVDAVIHLAWLIQPSHVEAVTRATNVDGTERLLRAIAEAGVRTLVYASSVGAYSPGPKSRRVDESWPVHGIERSFYSRHKAEVERMLDRFELERPRTRVVRMRPGLIFKREAASEIQRLFIGRLLPAWLARPESIPVVPDMPRLRFQAVHSLDAGDAYRRALLSDARGAFNVVAEPVLDPTTLSVALHAHRLRFRAGIARTLADLTWRLRLQPSPPGWIELALSVPLLDATRARRELGWAPRRSATDALLELIEGLHDRADAPTPPLARGFERAWATPARV